MPRKTTSAIFADLVAHPVILVTGFHRSGTTIAAKMIAHDTGHDFVREEEFNFTNVEAFECMIEADYGPKVIQCPFMACRIHHYTDCFVVWMVRPIEEIKASISQMQTPAGEQLFGHGWLAREMAAYHTERDLFEVKQENWELQRERVQHLELPYHSLVNHPLWVPKEQRDWHYRATEHAA